MNRLQHIIPSGIIAAIGLWIAYISYTQQPSEAFLFPRLIATVFVVLALWTFAKACMGRARTGDGISLDMVRNIAPGLVVMVIYVFFLAKGLGFYTACAIATFALLTLYDPAPLTNLVAWGKRLLITAVFTAVMYGLFAMLLTVYTPREIFF
jgi:hypothetical protein